MQCNLWVLFSSKFFDKQRKEMKYSSVATWHCQADSFQKRVHCTTNNTAQQYLEEIIEHFMY